MEFSDLYKQSNGSLVRFSPSGEYVAVAVEHRLIVRTTQTPKLIHRVFGTAYTARPFIEALEWSPCGRFLLTASYAMSRADVWSLDDDTWRCTLVDEVSRITRAQWGLDATRVLTHSELNLRLTIWTLHADSASSRQYVQYPRALAVGADHYAVAFRQEAHRDVVGLYSSDWRQVGCVGVEQMREVRGMRWSPDGLHLCLWGGAATWCLAVVNLAGVVKRVEAVEDRLGVRDVAWSPTGQLLAVEGVDGDVRVLNHLTWRPVATLRGGGTGAGAGRGRVAGGVDVFVETPLDAQTPGLQQQQRAGGRVPSRFALLPTPATLPTSPDAPSSTTTPTTTTAASPDDPRPSYLSFSPDGTLLAQHSPLNPSRIAVWRVGDMRLVALVCMLGAVRMCRWSPVENSLAFVTGPPTVYMWGAGGGGCRLWDVPAEVVAVGGLRWCPSGEALAVVARGVFALAYVTE
ncbi:hypothetical protein LPJ53_001023 [Coemansia erecta]|uniref:WD40 repeat-like protein n=1 Tax=Coemansia erecta TaxID=147472 RepID=A0A9W7Y7B8_9FUNG|nr:hypothetical protein LPJ53_001023 [Coemansia erecta]